MIEIRPDGDDPMTSDEHDQLERARYNVAANHDDYTNSDLLAALRIGYALGWKEAERERWRISRRKRPSKVAEIAGKRHDYAKGSEPVQVTEPGLHHGWWASTCPLCGKTEVDYRAVTVKRKMWGHIVGGHYSWAERQRNRKGSDEEKQPGDRDSDDEPDRDQ